MIDLSFCNVIILVTTSYVFYSRKYDYENYLASLLIAPDDLRRAAFALRAFNVELAQIRDLTKTDAIAQMRFQFWSDLVDEMYAEKGNTDGTPNLKYARFPVASELYDVLTSSEQLSKHWLKRMITARQEAANLSAFPFQTMEQLEKYADSTIVSLYYLLNEKIVELVSVKDDDQGSGSSPGYRIALDHIASHLGKAQGLTNVLRGVKHNAAARRCYIPNEVLLSSHCTHEDFLRGNNNEAVVEAIFAIASQANSHLEHAVELLDGLSSGTARHRHRADKLVYLPYLAVRTYLEQLRRCDFNLWHGRLQQKNGLLPLKLWWRSKLV